MTYSQARPLQACRQWIVQMGSDGHCPDSHGYTSGLVTPCAPAGGEDAQIGIVHNHMVYEPLNPNWANRSYLVYICSILNYVWGTKVLLEYFK